MNKIIPDLTPNQTYAIQFRLRNDRATSPWSNIIRFETTSDQLAPAKVTGLTLASIGSTFSAEWDEVTTNEDDSELSDFKDYEVAIKAGTVVKRYFTTEPSFDFTIEANTAAFGLPKPQVAFTVKARDLSGNTVTIGATASASNSVPAPVTGERANASGNSVSVNWNASDIDDFKEYQVLQSFDEVTWVKVWSGFSTTALIDTTQYVEHFFKVRILDVFNQFSESSVVSATPLVQFGTDLEAPDAPGNLETAAGSQLVGSTWNYFITAKWDESVANDLASYEYRYSIAGEGEWYYGSVTDSNVFVGNLSGGQNYDFQVRSIDLSSNPSEWVVSTITTVVDAEAPKKPAAPLVSGDTQAVLVTHDLKDYEGNLLADDTAFLAVYSGMSGFTPSASNYLGEVSVSAPSVSILAGGKFARPVTATSGSTATVYVRVIAIDRDGNRSLPSDQTPVVLNLISNANIADATIGSAKILDLAADKIKANTTFTNSLNVGSKFTVSAGGTIESENFSVSDRTGFRISNTSLTMYDGAISARSLELQESSANLLPAAYALFDYSAQFYQKDVGLYWNAIGTPAVQDFAFSRFGDSSLKVIHNAPAGEMNQVSLASGLDDLNIVLEPNQDYILSAYIRPMQASPADALMIGFMNDNDVATPFSLPVMPANVWTRVWISFNSGEIQNTHVVIKTLQPGTWNIDGIQLEPKIGKLDEPSVFKLPGITRIDGRSITTGQISSSQLTTSGDTTLPAWSINLEGNAMLNDVLVRGKIVVGGSSYSVGQQDAMAIQSYNYVPGVSGWAIKGSGDVEFFNGIFRGRIEGSDIIGSQYKTSEAGRRIEMGGGPSYAGEIRFVSSYDSNNFAFIKSFTVNAQSGFEESIIMGAPMRSTDDWLWNSVALHGNEWITLTGRMVTAMIDGGASAEGLLGAFTVELVFDRDDVAVRRSLMFLSDLNSSFYLPNYGRNGQFNVSQRLESGAVTRRFGVLDDYAVFAWIGTEQRAIFERGADADTSTRLSLMNSRSYGISLKYIEQAAATNGRLEVRDAADTVFQPVWASGFVVSSSGVDKSDINALSTSALDVVDRMTVREYKRRVPKVSKPRREKNDTISGSDIAVAHPPAVDDINSNEWLDVKEVGLIGEEAPAEVVKFDTAGNPVVDLYAQTSFNTGSIQELHAMIKVLREEIERLKKKGK